MINISENKKKILFSSTAVIVATAVAVTSFNLSSNVALAKETFRGITKIVEKNDEDNPFMVYELVPGRAHYSQAVENEEDVELELSMGELSYYMEGQEPTGLSANLVNFPTSAARKTFVDKLIRENGDSLEGPLASITSKEKDVAPLYYSEYEEAYSLTDEELEQAKEEGKPWSTLYFDLGHEEHISGIKMEQSDITVSDDNIHYGKYKKLYNPKDDATRITELNAMTAGAVLEILPEGSAGEFDPAFDYAGADGAYNVKFERNASGFGYYVVNATEIKSKSKYADNTYVYYRDRDGYYSFYDTFGNFKDGLVGVLEDDEEDEEAVDETVEDEETPAEEEDSSNVSDNNVPTDESSDDASNNAAEDNNSNDSAPSDNSNPEGSDNSQADTPNSDESGADKADNADSSEGNTAGDESETNSVAKLEALSRRSFASRPEDNSALEDEAENKEEGSEENNGNENKETDDSENVTTEPADNSEAANPEETEASKDEQSDNEQADTEIPGESVSDNQLEDAEDSELEDKIESDDLDGLVINKEGYFVVEFGYANGQVGDGASYNVVAWEESVDNSTSYNFNVDELVVPNYAKNGRIKGNGEEDFVYHYSYDEEREIGSGNYYMINDDTTKDLTQVYRLTNTTIYYRGGFSNQNWFTRHVFDRDVDEDGYLLQNVDYYCTDVTPGELNNINLGGVDLLYLSAPDGKYLPEGAELPEGYQGDQKNDISETTMWNIIYEVMENGLPVIVDSRLLDKSKYNMTYLYLLAHILQHEDLELFYAKNRSKMTYQYADEAIDLDGFKTGHKVNGSVYVYDYSLHKTDIVNTDFITESEEYTDRDGNFSEVWSFIETENIYRDANGEKVMIDEKVNEAVAIKYILCYADRKNTKVKGKIRVLELEPMAVPEKADERVASHLYVHKGEEDGKKYYELKHRSLDGDKSKDSVLLESSTEISIDSISTAEFAGRVADINSEYDLIYIGLATYNMNMSDGKTKYNDSSMNGLIYSHVGDLIKNSYTRNGAYETFATRFSGTDITRPCKNALKSYVAGGYPVLTENGVYKKDGDDYKVATDLIDNSSNLYEFLNSEAGKLNKKNVFMLDGIGEISDDNLFIQYLNMPKPEIVLDTAISWTDQNQEIKPEDGKYYMKYRFEIADERATSDDETYDCQLYVDRNADGKYSDKERISAVSIYDEGGREVSRPNGFFKLKTGQTYMLYHELALEDAGPLPWKLQVILNENENLNKEQARARRDSCIGCYSYWPAGTEVEVRILQIRPESKAVRNSEITPSSIWDITNTQEAFGGYGGIVTSVWELMDSLAYYDVDMSKQVSLTSSEFIEKINADPTYLDKFNVLLLGISNNYNILVDALSEAEMRDPDKLRKAEYAASRIEEYIDSGKSTVICSDVISPYKEEGLKAWWGVDLTRRLRGKVGLDRYGYTGIEQDTLDKAYKPKSGRSSSFSGDDTIGHGIVWADIMRNWPYAYKDNDQYQLPHAIETGQNLVNHDNDTIREINKGQITMYPFSMNALTGTDELKPPMGHYPYYTLDLDGDLDGDEKTDTVVWYAYSGGNKYATQNSMNARDMYYLYTRDNVTFVNLGKAIDSENFCWLMVNALINAYENGEKGPAVHIVEENNINSQEIDYIYISEDEEDLTNDNMIPVYWYVSGVDNNTQLIANFYKEISEYEYYNNPFYYEYDHDKSFQFQDKDGVTYMGLLWWECKLYDAETGQVFGDGNNGTLVGDVTINGERGNPVKANHMYKVEVPASLFLDLNNRLPNAEGAKICVKATNPQGKKSEGEGDDRKLRMNPTGYDYVTIINTGLFNLD